MKVKVYDLEGNVVEEIDTPLFEGEVREELIRRAVLSDESYEYQPKGAYKWAGMETSARYIGRKGAYATLKNQGQARLPREILGGGRHGRVRRIPQSVKGRRAHPPKPEKIIIERMNKKEYLLALRNALAASKPIVFVDDLENIAKTKKAYSLLSKLIGEELQEAKESRKRITGVRRRRKARAYKVKRVGAVIGSKVLKAFENIPGLFVVDVEGLKVKHLAPGGVAQRYVILTKSALKALEERVRA
ncbi:MAG: 50S ribosomal protein L4 [Candidatus Micrarchaeota archaeon]|nr:50S ribosomal protein L4 [Candidatus Micrarchaeota archaeon]